MKRKAFESCLSMMTKLPAIFLIIWFGIATSKRLVVRSIVDNEVDQTDSNSNSFDQSWVTAKAINPEIRASPGEIVEIECEASGSPAPLIQFYNDALGSSDNEVFSNEISKYSTTALVKVKAKLRFTARTSEIIFCKAKSGSKTSHVPIKVIVSEREINFLGNDVWEYTSKQESLKYKAPRITYFDTMYLDNIDSTVVLPCTVSGAGETHIVWLNTTEDTITNNEDKRITITPFGDLKIRNIRWSDMGPYTCIARNNYGEDSITTFLYPMLADK